MRFDALIGGSYNSQSPLADCSRTVNWYPEQLQDENATAKQVLYPTPGVATILQVTSGYGRGHFARQGREFAVIGSTLWEISSTNVATSRGTVAVDANPATICSNGDYGDQLFITSGGNGYVYNLTANTLTQITALNGKATMGDHLDGYFLALDGDTSTLYISDLADGTNWETGIQFAQRSAMPDRWHSMKVVGRFIALLGERTSEIWYDAGDLVPMALYPGAPIIQYGVKAPFSPAVIGDYLIWLAQTSTGKVCVCLLNGTQASVVSTYPLESALSGYDGAEFSVGDAYSDKGHSFYLIGFDRAHITWAFDLETKLWHERGTWNPDANRYDAWRPRFYAYAHGEHRMLDVQSRSLLRMSDEYTTDADGSYIRRLRRSPALANGNDRIFYGSLELLMEPGIGVVAQQPPTPNVTWVAEDS
jgi:hypothetical protein